MSFDEEQLHQENPEEADTTSEQTQEPGVSPAVIEGESPSQANAETASENESPSQTNIETADVSETPSQPSIETANVSMETPDDSMAQAAYDESFKRLSRGQLVEGTVVQIDSDSVLVDVGTKSEGIIPLSELSSQNLQSTEGIVSVGEKINVVVLQPENQEGNPVLSKKRADFSDAWDNIETALREQRVLNAMVIERVKGGLVVDVGVRGFVPATHVGNGKLRNIERYVGQSIPLKVLEIDRERRKVVLSNKLAEDERREVMKTEVFGKIKPNQILEGTVRRIVEYGAFVELNSSENSAPTGVDGLLHISEMSWTRINHPSEVLKEGDKIRVMVLRTDPDAGKISLGLRQVLPDPWSLVADNYTIGQAIELPVSRVVTNGAFVKLPEGVEGFIPIGEMSYRRINRSSDVVSEGQVVNAQILEMNPDARRMVLSLKALQQQEERQEVQKHMPSQQAGGTTIGERLGGLGALRGLLTDESGESAPEENTSPAAPAPEAPQPSAPNADEGKTDASSAAPDTAETAAPEQASEPRADEISDAPVSEAEAAVSPSAPTVTAPEDAGEAGNVGAVPADAESSSAAVEAEPTAAPSEEEPAEASEPVTEHAEASGAKQE